jgi:hypothetical protein
MQNRGSNVSIALNYIGASGIRLQDIAGPAGLGWSLQAGGVITRMVRGGPDERSSSSAPGYLTGNNSSKMSGYDTSSATFKSVFKITNTVNPDLEPDVYNSSIGGRIIFDSGQQANFINEEGYRIIQNGLFSSDSTWVIADKQGNQYFFGRNTTEREHSIYEVDSSSPYEYISSWYLSQIQSIDGSIIYFTYLKASPTIYEYYERQRSTPSYTLSRSDSVFKIKTVDPLYINTISTDNETVAFDYSDRLDFPGSKALSAMRILNNHQQLISKYVFQMDYFKSKPVNSDLRLKLSAIRQYEAALIQSNLIARFSYNEIDNLPSRHGATFDNWGYYNSNNTGKYFISDGAVKTTDPTKIKANLLTAIQWPTGGSTQYEFEANVYHQGTQDYVGGGIRIANIKQVKADGSVLTTSYGYLNESGYSSGLLNNDPDAALGYKTTYTTISGSSNVTTTIEADLPIQKLTDLNGISVQYSMVTVTNPDSGKIINYFNDYNLYPDVLDGYFSFSSNGFISYKDDLSSQYKGFSSYTSSDLKRGLLKRREIRNSNGQLVQSIYYNYNYVAGTSIPGSQAVFISSFNGYDYFYGSLYHENILTPQLISVLTYNYDPATGNHLNNTSVQNTYKSGAWPYLLARQSHLQSDGSWTNIAYTYASDVIIPNRPLMTWYLYDANIMTPLETVSSITRGTTELVTGATLITYQMLNNPYMLTSVPVPYQKLSLKINNPINDYQHLTWGYTYDNRLKPDMTFNNYHIDGQLLQSTGNDNTPVAIIWGYNKQYPIAKAINATIDQIAYNNCEEIADFDNEINNTNIFFGDNQASDYSNDSKTGKKSYQFASGDYAQTQGTLPGGNYVVSYWSKNGQLSFGTNYNLTDIIDKNADVTGWAYHQVTISLSSSTYLKMYPSSAGMLIDDIRIYPVGAQMTTYTYDPTAGVTSSTDANNITTYYEYDNFQRLSNIKDNYHNIATNYQYNYVNAVNSPDWEDTGTKQCIIGANGLFTEEQQMQQKDINPTSITYNQLRWRSLGYTAECMPTVYVKLYATNIQNGSDGASVFTTEDLTVKTYQDAACTIPIDLPINPEITLQGIGSLSCSNTTSTEIIKPGITITRKISVRYSANLPGHTQYPPGYNCGTAYSLVGGNNYIIVQ